MKQKTLLTYASIGTMLLTTGCASKQDQKKIQKKPNVIFILGDDIGYGDLGFNGEPTISTPTVDRIAKQGVRFTNAHCTAATSTPSRYSLLTGMYNWRRHDTGIAPGDGAMVIKPEQFTVADLFQQAGYKTAAIGKWHLGIGDKRGEQDWNGFITPGLKDIGFDYSYIMAATGDRVPCVFLENQRIANLRKDSPVEVSYKKNFPGEPTGKDNPELLYKMKPSPHQGHAQSIVGGISRIGYMKGGKGALWDDETISDSICNRAAQFIDKNKNNPFFMYFCTNDIHVPRVPNPRFIGKSGMGNRGDAILEFDWCVQQVLDAVKKAGVEDNTIIVITSDNGPVLDDGYQDKAVELVGKHRPWGEFRGGKCSNFEAGTRIPMIVYYPGVTKPAVSNAMVSHIDFLASFADMLGEKIPENQATDSQNYWETLIGKSTTSRDYVITSAGSLSISTNDWKYIQPSNGAAYARWIAIELGNDKAHQLYNLRTDIGEKHNVYNENKKVGKELIKLLVAEKKK